MKTKLALFAVLLSAGCSLYDRPAAPHPIVWFEQAEEGKQAPDLGASPLALDEVLQVALARNAGLEAAERRWRAARLRPEQAAALPDPIVTLGRFVEEIVTRNGGIEWTFGVQQPAQSFFNDPRFGHGNRGWHMKSVRRCRGNCPSRYHFFQPARPFYQAR